MPILGVCWTFFFVGMNYYIVIITYHYHLFLHPLVMAAFELTINYYHGIADATTKRDGEIRKIRILSRVKHIPTWR